MNRFDASLPGYGVAVDMGASHVRLVLADDQGEISREIRDRVQLERGPRGIIDQIREGIAQLLVEAPGRGEFRGIAIGVPGAVHPKTGKILDANNVPGWRDVDLGRDLEQAFGVPVFLDNDANMAAIGERWRGTARGVDNFVFIALGTGIGTGIFMDGRICRGHTGSAGEIFRMNVEWSRWREEFPDTGFLESYVAGVGLSAAGRSLLSHGNGAGKNLVEERDARFIFDAAERGDAQAQALIDQSFTILGVGVANMVSVLDPELIVFNGGLVRGAPDQLLATVERVVGKIHPIAPQVRLSTLGDKAQIWGALCTLLHPEQNSVIRTAEPARRG